ncbi:MAG: glycosyl transferase [Clostridia bacterium]|nr:glycosyl transferase [Clostridia bacterium]
MKKVMFISFPASGHVNASVNVCKELASRNVKVIYYTLEEHFYKFAGHENIEVRGFPENFKKYYYEKAAISGKIMKSLVRILHMVYSFTDILMPFVIDEVEREKPDLIMGDALSVYAKIIARMKKIPLVLVFTFLIQTDPENPKPPIPPGAIRSMLLNFPTFIDAMNIKNSINKKYGNFCDEPGDFLHHQDEFTIVTTSKEFQPKGHLFGDNVKFMGPTNVKHSTIPEVKDTIFVSIGTVQSNNLIWDSCINATRGMGYKVKLTFAGNKQNKVTLKDIPDNVTIYDNLTPDEYRDIISQSVLFISHGGINSVSDAILGMTPILVIPGNDETVQMGQLVEKYRCGRMYAYKKIDEKKLREEISRIINDSSTRSGLAAMRQSFLNSMGCKKVVDEMGKKFNLF